jgi:hypothetical protein
MSERDGPDDRSHSDRWMTSVRNHSKATLACDFFVTVTANFRMLYVLCFAKIPADRNLDLRACPVRRADSLCRQNPTARQVSRRPNPNVRVGCVCSIVREWSGV